MDKSNKKTIYKKVLIGIIIMVALCFLVKGGLSYFYTHDSNKSVYHTVVISGKTQEIEVSSVIFNIPTNFILEKGADYFTLGDSSTDYVVRVDILDKDFNNLLDNYSSLRPNIKVSYHSSPIIKEYKGKKYIVMNAAKGLSKMLFAITDAGENKTLSITIVNKPNTYDYKLLEKLVSTLNSAHQNVTTNEQAESNEEKSPNETNEETKEYTEEEKREILGYKDCNDLEKELNFTDGKIQYYCYSDANCYYNVNKFISYVAHEAEWYDGKVTIIEENKPMIEVFNLEDGKISLTKNGDEKNKSFIGNIDNVKTYRIHFSVQGGPQLFVLKNNNELYLYSNKNENDLFSVETLLMKNVKDFDTFEGNDYKLCVGESEGQNIQIAVHTTGGKFIQASPFDLARAN